MRKWMIGAMTCMAVQAALGQSFNVDMNAASGAGAGLPSDAFKGAAGVAGRWNATGTALSTSLRDVANLPTPVTLVRSGGGAIVNNSSGALSGDHEKLLEDAFAGSSGTTLTFTFNNLVPAKYALYTYAINPSSPIVSIVNVTGSTSQSNQEIGTIMAGPSYFAGATHALHTAEVGAGGTLTVTIAPTGSGAQVAGFQLVQLASDRLRIYVDDSAVGAGLGSSWTDAFTHPVTALSTARVAGGRNSEVWVANGIYKPTNTTNRSVSFVIPDRIRIYGGFFGTEASLAQRPEFSLTYLNGNIGSTGLSSDNSYTVVVADGVTADTVIDGFRIHNGNNDELGTMHAGRGGGMRIQGGSPMIRNCTFVGNEASNAGAGAYSDAGSPTFANCRFYDNESFTGSAVYHAGTLPIKLYNCEFMSNSAYEGTVKFADSDGMIAGGWFHGNYAGNTGGGVETAGANSGVTLVQCTFAGNTAGNWGGGVFTKNGAVIALRNSILWENASGFGQSTLEEQYDTAGGASIQFSANAIQGASGSTGLDPLFVDGIGPDNVWGTFDDNCRLREESPAINLGGNGMIPQDLADLDGDGDTDESMPFDFDGNPRVVDTVVDKGAFEYQPQPSALLGDMNCDGLVTPGDIAGFVLALTDPSGYAAQYPECNIQNGDMNGDEVVTPGDIAGFVAALTSL